ncbi:Toxin Doc [Planctomycetes bacterium Pan216]|uniref:Toxin Doc n=1 Tax=Kolteria novifilia TaxID=2527975 RepID=A0A518BA65_9BACT|nr:Toxin Doc [Planctomycetes bacterium Pan216]
MSHDEPSPRFLTRDEALLLHGLAVAEFGGDPGIRDEALLDSALAQPRSTFGGKWLHEHPFEMAAAYAFHLARNHPFIDGNKRIAWLAMRAFLLREGYQLRPGDERAVRTVLGAATGVHDKGHLAPWIERHATPR